MQGRLFVSLGLLGLVNCQQQQPAMALERRDICLVSCGEGWCCVSGQKCIAGPSKDFSTPYGCEDEILGFHTTWEAYRGDFKEWTSTAYTQKPEPTPHGPPAEIITSRSTTTSYDFVATPSVAPPPPPPYYTPSSEAASTTAIVSYPAGEPESSSSSPASSPPYVKTSYPSYPESSSTPSIISYSTSYSNSAANTITPPSSTPTTNAPQPAKTTVVPASAGRVSLGNTIAAVSFVATLMGFLMA